MSGISYKGIYAIYINEKPYVGKDSNIFQSNRLTQHLMYLRRGSHYNKDMQKDYDTYGEDSITYSMLTFSKKYSENELRELEQFYVNKLDSFNNGYNETEGGVGMFGYKYSDEKKENRSIRFTGEDNPTSKLTNAEFYEIVDLLKKGYTNEEIGELYSIHDRYVSLIRHKKRFKRLWGMIDYTPSESTKGKENRKLSYQDYKHIRQMIEKGCKNKDIEDEYNLASGSGSRLRHGKLYADFYEKYHNEK